MEEELDGWGLFYTGYEPDGLGELIYGDLTSNQSVHRILQLLFFQ